MPPLAGFDFAFACHFDCVLRRQNNTATTETSVIKLGSGTSVAFHASTPSPLPSPGSSAVSVMRTSSMLPLNGSVPKYPEPMLIWLVPFASVVATDKLPSNTPFKEVLRVAPSYVRSEERRVGKEWRS